MPEYEYECQKCGFITELFMMPSELDKQKAFCGQCQGEMKRNIVLSNIQEDYKPYFDENINDQGEFVKSRKHRKELMKLNNLVEIG